MLLEPVLNTLLLLALGSCGWLLFKVLHLPAAALLGTIAAIGALRIAGLELPVSPPLLSPLVQVLVGIFVGARVTGEALKELKELLRPALIIVAWALSVIFPLGLLLYRFTSLDLYTGILSSSIGGLPEMTILALETGADVAAVIVMQMARMIATVVVFPFVVHRQWALPGAGKESAAACSSAGSSGTAGNPCGRSGAGGPPSPSPGGLYGSPEKAAPTTAATAAGESEVNRNSGVQPHLKPTPPRQKGNGREGPAGGDAPLASAARFASTLIIATGGALLFYFLGVPAGAMVGSMLFTAAASARGLEVKSPSPGLFGLMLVGVGIMVSDNISPETMEVLLSGGLVLPLIISTLVILGSSFLVAFLISRSEEWDLPTSFLAAAPGGFSVMTALALSSGRNPLRVSMLHLCRLVALKTVVPLALMFLA